jgi:hypothetical protein
MGPREKRSHDGRTEALLPFHLSPRRGLDRFQPKNRVNCPRSGSTGRGGPWRHLQDAVPGGKQGGQLADMRVNWSTEFAPPSGRLTHGATSPPQGHPGFLPGPYFTGQLAEIGVNWSTGPTRKGGSTGWDPSVHGSTGRGHFRSATCGTAGWGTLQGPLGQLVEPCGEVHRARTTKANGVNWPTRRSRRGGAEDHGSRHA